MDILHIHSSMHDISMGINNGRQGVRVIGTYKIKKKFLNLKSDINYLKLIVRSYYLF